MKLLEGKILSEGKVLPGDVLKIDSFINHQIDVGFCKILGSEFYRLFNGEKITKVLTVEASGIAVSCATADLFKDSKVVFAKKVDASNMNGERYSSLCHSYTRNKDYSISVAKEYLSSDDVVLIIDDFLATGQALNALLDICSQAKCKVVGCGIIVEKSYQPGGKEIRDRGIRVESLARIKYMDDAGNIEFE